MISKQIFGTQTFCHWGVWKLEKPTGDTKEAATEEEETNSFFEGRSGWPRDKAGYTFALQCLCLYLDWGQKKIIVGRVSYSKTMNAQRNGRGTFSHIAFILCSKISNLQDVAEEEGTVLMNVFFVVDIIVSFIFLRWSMSNANSKVKLCRDLKKALWLARKTIEGDSWRVSCPFCGLLGQHSWKTSSHG